MDLFLIYLLSIVGSLGSIFMALAVISLVVASITFVVYLVGISEKTDSLIELPKIVKLKLIILSSLFLAH